MHWPTIVFVKYFFSVVDFSVQNGLATLAGTLAIALAVDRLIDAHVRKLKRHDSNGFCAVIFVTGNNLIICKNIF